MIKKLLNALVFLGTIAAAGLLGVQFFVCTPEAVQQQVLLQLKGAFSGTVKVGAARVSALSSLSVHDVTLSDPQGQETFLTLKSATLSLDLTGLLSGEVRFSELAIDGLEVSVTRGADGRFTFERYLAKKTAEVHFPRLRWEALAAAAGSADGLEAPKREGVSIHRILVRGGRVNYLDGFMPVQVQHISGALKLDPGQLEILTLRGRAFDRFPIAINGVASLPGPGHKLEVRLDEVPLKPLLSFVGPLNLLLTIAHEQLEGWLAVVATSHADPHGEGMSLELKFRDLKWVSRMLASSINAPHASLTLSTRGPVDALKLEGDTYFEMPLVRPSSFTQDIALEDFHASVETGRAFARLRGYTAKLRHGALSGSGYASWATAKPDYELGFNLERVPLPEIGLAGPESAAMARDILLTLKGRVLPGGVQLTTALAELGTSRLTGAGNIVSDGLSWLVRDASARVEIDGGDLARMLGIGSAVKIAGKLAGTLFPQGPVGQLRGTGKLDAAKLSIAPASGGEALPVVLEESPVELSGTQLVLPDTRGTLLGGTLRTMVALSTQPLSGNGARMNFDLAEVDAAAIAKIVGAADLVKSGKITLEGLIGSRINVGSGPGGPPPAAIPDTRVTGVLASAPVTGTTAPLELAGPVAPYAPPPPSSPPPPPPPSLPPMPAGPMLSGNVIAHDVVAALPKGPVRLDRATARLGWDADGLAIGSISGQGPDGELTGSLRLEGPGKARGKLTLASKAGEVAIEVGH